MKIHDRLVATFLDVAFLRPSPQPKNIKKCTQRAQEAGQRFIESSFPVPNHALFRLGEQRLNSCIGDVFRSDRPDETWLNVFRVFFWQGARKAMREGKEKGDLVYVMIGACIQRSLARALIGMNDVQRDWMRTHSRNQAEYSGALAVARAARSLHELGARVALPTIELDIFYKVDLLIQRPTDPPSFICVQIKARAEEDSRIRILEPTHQTAKAMQRFCETYNVCAIPLYAEIGHGGLTSNRVAPLTQAKERFQQLLLSRSELPSPTAT